MRGRAVGTGALRRAVGFRCHGQGQVSVLLSLARGRGSATVRLNGAAPGPAVGGPERGVFIVAAAFISSRGRGARKGNGGAIFVSLGGPVLAPLDYGLSGDRAVAGPATTRPFSEL